MTAGADAPAGHVIAQFGGQSALARAIGANPSTVQHWAKTGHIPLWRRAAIRHAAGERGIALPDERGAAPSGDPPSPAAPVPPPGPMRTPTPVPIPVPLPPSGPPSRTRGGEPLPHGRADPPSDAEALREEIARLRETVTLLTEEVTRLRQERSG